jgi:hypothetical protein
MHLKGTIPPTLTPESAAVIGLLTCKSVFDWWTGLMEERALSCLREGQLVHQVDLLCYEPLEQGPCPSQGEWFALVDRYSG